MPIHCPLRIQPIPDETFESIDRLVMGCCYASQNALGRLCDERVYENDVAARLRSEGGGDVHTQVPVTVTHQSFSKTYRLDLVVGGTIYEFKTVSAFAPDHDAQGIHYAALTATDRVKLINFRSEKVRGRLLRSPMWRVDRRQFTVTKIRWQPLSEECGSLLTRVTALLGDWGAFLEARLFEAGLVHFCGGEAPCVRRLPVSRDGLELGTHCLACHAAEAGFVVTAFTGEAVAHESQLRRLLQCLPLRGLQWINLNHSELQLVTLSKGKGMEARE